jgi:GT2 family glycosyltransferase
MDSPPTAPRIKVIVTLVEGSDIDAALATVSRQAYEALEEVVVVGGDGQDLPEGVTAVAGLEQAIASAEPRIDYLWILHSDARPRPDALQALVDEVERGGASLGGSKVLVAGTGDVLESIGSATDVFGDPVSGLEEGEIDLQQYDVVREVAFVSSVSMLVRRDLAQGLGGLDEALPPGAAGLDFSQRARLAGGRVIIVPSSEIYHQGKCVDSHRGWREEAGRIRAMLKAYRLLTLAWVVPVSLLASLLDSIANLSLLRWRPLARHGAAWAWNLLHLPSTVSTRIRLRKVRVMGDEELFRFQARGSVQLRDIGSQISDRLLFMFDDDHALIRSTRRAWSSPGIWGAILAGALAVVSARSIIFTGVPTTGFSFPFEAPTVALDRFFAGWNDSGLGSPAGVHPSSAVTGVLSLVWFGAEGAARILLTLTFAFLAVTGMGRLAGRLGYRGPGRYLAGLVLLAGPGTAAAVGAGSWLALGGAALLPWAVRSVVFHETDQLRSWLTHVGWALLWSMALAAFSPVLVVVPLLTAALWRVSGGHRARVLVGVVALSGLGVASAFLVGDPGWALDSGRRLGLVVHDLWPALVVVAALPMLYAEGRTRRLSGVGAVLALTGLVLVRLPLGGPGVEEAALVMSSFGAAIVVGSSLEVLSSHPRRRTTAAAALGILALSAASLADGRLGLPPGDDNARLGFAAALADESGTGRILVLSAHSSLIPGEARPGPGLWYRTVDGGGMTLDEVWLPPELDGDTALAEAIARISAGSELRPGESLAEFAIKWVVIEGDGLFVEEFLGKQLDLVPTPLASGSKVYENTAASPLAHDGVMAWRSDGADYVGDPGSGRVRLAINHDQGWAPEPAAVTWAATASAFSGVAAFSGDRAAHIMAYGTVALFVVSLVAIALGRART